MGDWHSGDYYWILVKIKFVMETPFSFGTYNVPSISVNLSASYTVPGILPKGVIEKIIAAEKSEGKENVSVFDDTLKAVLSVPKPVKKLG